jgi:signal transduction histidine kinase
MLIFIIGNASRVQSNWGESINNNSVFEALDYPSILGGLSGSFFFSLIVLNALYTAANNRKRKELNQQLIATNINYQAEKIAFAKQRQLTGMLVHEIKNPLAASQFALANMERNLNDKDLSIDRLSTINQSLNEINTIIDKCLEVDLYEQGLLTTHSRTVALNELLSTLKTPVNEERIYIINRDLADELYISGDAFYIKTIFLNLVSNALKYSPDDSLVEIVFSTVRRDSQDLLSVSISNEPGIAGYPDKNQVFNRFYRAESARSVSGSGTGLWLAKQMARDIGAELELQDSAPNITFHLLLKMPPNKR